MKINRLLLWIVVLLTIAYLSLKLLFLPAYVSSLSFGSETISITRDSYNIPHIKAETKRGAYYALGFVSAEDRLFQMHLKRMLTQGRLSEMFGEKSLPVDKMFRSVGIGYWAVEAAARVLLAVNVVPKVSTRALSILSGLYWWSQPLCS